MRVSELKALEDKIEALTARAETEEDPMVREALLAQAGALKAKLTPNRAKAIIEACGVQDWDAEFAAAFDSDLAEQIAPAIRSLYEVTDDAVSSASSSSASPAVVATAKTLNLQYKWVYARLTAERKQEWRDEMIARARVNNDEALETALVDDEADVVPEAAGLATVTAVAIRELRKFEEAGTSLENSPESEDSYKGLNPLEAEIAKLVGAARRPARVAPPVAPILQPWEEVVARCAELVAEGDEQREQELKARQEAAEAANQRASGLLASLKGL